MTSSRRMTSVFPSWWPLPGDPNPAAAVVLGREGGLTLARLWLALAGFLDGFGQPIRWPEVMGAESVGLASSPKAPLPTQTAGHIPTILACPTLCPQSPSHPLFPKDTDQALLYNKV